MSICAALGTPPEGRLAARRRERDRFLGDRRGKARASGSRLDLQQAADIATAAPACLLCYEADWRDCHRRRIAEILSDRHGLAVRHLNLRGAGAPSPP